MPVALMVNLVIRTLESIVSFGFFQILMLWCLFSLLYMYTNVISIF